MSSHRFLQNFCVQHARCECAAHAGVVFDVLQMICGISAAAECILRLFARSFGAEVRRFRGQPKDWGAVGAGYLQRKFKNGVKIAR